MVGRPSEFTREWAYTSLSRAREPMRVYAINEVTGRQHEREEDTPPEPQRSNAEAVDVLRRAMTRTDAEPLALMKAAATEISETVAPPSDLPLTCLRRQEQSNLRARALQRYRYAVKVFDGPNIATTAAVSSDEWSLATMPPPRAMRTHIVRLLGWQSRSHPSRPSRSRFPSCRTPSFEEEIDR